jgi:endonuclease YncB( thermonuclease family)
MVHDRHVVISILFAAASLCLALPSAAFACDLPPGQKGTVAEVRDGETLALTHGTLVRLINAKAPAAPLAGRSDRPWHFVAEAKQALSELVSGAEVELRYGGAKADRHGPALT